MGCLRALAAVGVFVVSMGVAAGQGLEVGSGAPIRIEVCRVAAEVEEGVARVEVDETFRNESGRVLEGVYRFRLPEDAVIGSFSMWMEGREKRGVVMEAAQARAVYDSIVRKQKDPGLLEQTGWREFRVNVFPIPAHDTVRVKLVYAHVVRDDLGLQTLEIPLPVRCGTVGDLQVRVDVRAERGLAGIDCPSHGDALLDCGTNAAAASWSGDGVRPEGPFVLRSFPKGEGFDVALLAHREEGAGSGFFLARVVPRLAEPPRIGRDLVFVIDRSGSMQGEKIEQARSALRAGLDTLRPGDRFDVISFSTDVTTLGDGRLLEATRENLERARRAVDGISASGGTNIHAALMAAIERQASDPGRFVAVVFLTDGQATVGQTRPERILADWSVKRGATRLFAFGVGRDVHDFLISKLAADGRGEARYVREGEDLEIPLAALVGRIRTPLLLDPVVEIEGEGIGLMDREPRQLPDLFQDRAFLIAGRYGGSGKAALRLTGRAGDEEIRVSVPIELPRATSPRPHLAQIWAKTRIERLLDDMRVLGANDEMRDEVLALGLNHRLVTPYTSFLVVEDGVRLAGGDRDARGDAQPAEEGTNLAGSPDAPGFDPSITSGSGGFLTGSTPESRASGGADTTPPGSPGVLGWPPPNAPTAGVAGLRPATGLGGKRSGSEGFERWEFWWEHNKEAFLPSEAFAARANRPDAEEIARRVVPALIEALAEPDADVADSAAIALAKAARAAGAEAAALPALLKALGHEQKTVRESAALALGILGSKDAIAPLRELLTDTEDARRTTGRPQGVDPLVRAFAAASLGMLRARETVPDLLLAAADRRESSRDACGMAILALGFMDGRHDEIVPFLAGLLGDRSLNDVLRAQAPLALAHLAEGSEAGAVAVRGILRSELLARFEDDRSDPQLRRSLAIGLGRVAAVQDADVIEALVHAVDRSNDDQTRPFSLMALAAIGARDADPAAHADAHDLLAKLFRRELTNPARGTHVPHAALALATYARSAQLPDPAREDASATLLDEFEQTANPSYAGAMAIALGMLGARDAANPLFEAIEDTKDAPLQGHIALALGLIGDATHTPKLRALLPYRGIEPKMRLNVARALGLLADAEAVPALLDLLAKAGTIAEAGAAAQALGAIGDRDALEPLLAALADATRPALARGFAAAALGSICAPPGRPWSAGFSIGVNHRAQFAALSELLDLL